MTVASDKGILRDVVYRVDGHVSGGSLDASYEVKVGDLVVLVDDDDTSTPYFNVVGKDGKVLERRAVISVVNTKLTAYISPEESDEKVEVIYADPLNYNVSICNGSTTIVIQKRLSMDEVHAVLKAIGA